MTYTIGQVAKKTGLTTHTLRFYDKEGLLPNVKKNLSGIRYFSDNDLNWIVILECLKSTGLSLKDIKHYIDLYKLGNKSLNERLEIFKIQKKRVKEQISLLKENMKKIDFKIKYYEEAIKNGEENIYEKNTYLAKERNRVLKLK
ncbi:MerR family transcriptional regulator [bacterium]|nr:MerR family transcriptional regulator [bacterium]